MDNFKNQIEQDINEYQTKFKYVSNIEKPEWAFNFWILDKLFFEDEELIEEKIIDYNDMGIDCYEIYEDTKEIYLIQNKYYSDNTKISSDYVKNDFLIRGISALENGTYSHCEELQNAFTKMKSDPDFTVHLQLFVANDVHNSDAEKYISNFNSTRKNYIATIYYLEDIKNRYFNEIEEAHNNLSAKIESVNQSTILKINSEAYNLENVLDARYVLTPVVSIYRMYRESLEKQYPLFDKNIREYLGQSKINKGIYQTLQDSKDRNNFFYYNNGITMICDNMSKIETKMVGINMNAVFTVENPQIVNGCQTVNSIYEFLKNVPANDLEREFKDTFVMLKILVIDRKNIEEKELYTNIVKYNNSQNKIDEKTFVANTGIFLRLQEEFEKKGLILLIKQSDKNKFSKKYKTITNLKKASNSKFKKFELKEPKKVSDFHINLEKLLQVINAFIDGGHTAYTKKCQMLVFNSTQYNNAVDFIKNDKVTIDMLIDLYLLYMRAEEEKSKYDDTTTRYPIPYYLIDFFALYECNGRIPENITVELSSTDKINKIIKLYRSVTKQYSKKYYESYDIDYNKMIKQNVKYGLVESLRETALDLIDF